MSTYLQILFFSIIIPFIFSFHKKINFHKRWPEFIKANILTSAPFIFWDEAFTAYGVWGFNKEHLAGFYLFNLPIEEILFFIIIPYCCVFTYEVFNKFSLASPRWNNITHSLSLMLASTIIIIGILSYSKLYTSITFISLGILLLIAFLKKLEFLQSFYITYALITASFFIIVNGLLTGVTLETPPVWYNNNENLSIRIWTIPIEDFFYSMLLLLSNIWLFEIFKSRNIKL